MSIPFLEKEELLDAAVDVGAGVVPTVGRVMFLDIGVGVGQITGKAVTESDCARQAGGMGALNCSEVRSIHFAGFGPDVGEGVEDVCQFGGG